MLHGEGEVQDLLREESAEVDWGRVRRVDGNVEVDVAEEEGPWSRSLWGQLEDRGDGGIKRSWDVTDPEANVIRRETRTGGVCVTFHSHPRDVSLFGF